MLNEEQLRSTRSSPGHPSSPAFNSPYKNDADLETQRLSLESLAVLERLLDTQHHALMQMGVLEPYEAPSDNIESEIRRLKTAVQNVRPRIRPPSRVTGPDPVSMRIGRRRTMYELDTVPTRGVSPARNGSMHFTVCPHEKTFRANCQRGIDMSAGEECSRQRVGPDHNLRTDVLNSPLSAFQKLN